MTILPIDSVLPDLIKTMQMNNNAVLVAPPGAGKTTRVPLALLQEDWLGDRRILMLEPRRLAARSAARYMADLLGENVGETVGYRVRMESRVGNGTRIEVITEGVLTRLLQNDPALEDVGLIIFDEFHERSLQSDLGLALCLQSQSVLRDDLRILIMSATIDAEPVAALLRDAPIIVSEGRLFPVETRYVGTIQDGKLEESLVKTILHALEHDTGDILVFLPGAAEIRRLEKRLSQRNLGEHIRIAPLYGSMPLEAQDLAIAPGGPGTRKIVLSTSIAETSLTVEGIRVVIDSGLMRVSRFSPRTGMTRLETTPVSLASADQRRGRAGRLAPGICYRLWTEQEHRRLAPRGIPEILESDLTPLALELAVWGITEPTELAWLDAPPTSSLSQAQQLLQQLGALDRDGRVTPHGKRIAAWGIHPRLAHMIEKAIPLQLGALACELAAIISERDFIRGQNGGGSADLALRVQALRAEIAGRAPEGEIGYALSIDHASLRRISAEAAYLKKGLGIDSAASGDVDAIGYLLAFAFPERIAQAKGERRFLLRNGRGAYLAETQPLSQAAYVVVAEVDDNGRESRIFRAAEVALTDLQRFFADQIEQEVSVVWDRTIQAVRATQRKRLGALVLLEGPLSEIDPDALLAALLEGIKQEGISMLPWSKAVRQLQQRMQFMHLHNPDWPDVSDASLEADLSWLEPYLHKIRSREDLQRLPLANILTSALSYSQGRELEESAPTHIVVPSGSRIMVDYSDPTNPVLAVRLQEMFGLKETPRIAGGRVPLTLHLLSPAHRPVQVTRDLSSFWQHAYFEVKKDLKGRYPKHYWPDDPTAAVPTNRTKPRQSNK